MSDIRRRLIGDRAFYKMVLMIVLPIIVQTAITNFVSLLDNLMVGSIGTDQMSGVAVANQLMFVFNLTCFGAVSGAGIFAAQYHGAGNTEGVRAAFRYKIYIVAIIIVIAAVLFVVADRTLISLYLNDENDPARVARTLQFGLDYLHIMVIGLLPFGLVQCYAGTLRETGETRLPMVAGLVAVFVNLVLNYLLIFGKFGFPELGVKGAAYATVISRYVELGIVMIYAHTHKKRYAFADGLYRTMRIPGPIVKEITLKGTPLMVNELVWAMGMATLTQIYSLRGLDVVAALNISSTFTNLFSVAFQSMGSAAAIIVGQDLGANAIETAKDHTRKLLVFSVMVATVTAIALAITAPIFPRLYDTTETVRGLSVGIMRAFSVIMLAHSFTHCAYFVIRSGGKTIITFLFDSGVTWLLCVPVAYLLANFTSLTIVPLYFLVQGIEFFKGIVAGILVHKGIWINNMVAGENMQA